MTQQDKTKVIIPKLIPYHYSFGKYIENYLPSFSVDDIEKFDLYANKNSKYLLYKFNDWTESLQGAEKLIIRHTAKAKDSVSLKTIEEKDRQFLIEKIIHGIEFNNPYSISSEKKPEITDTVEQNYRISRRVYRSLFVDIADSFIEYIHSLNVDEIQQLDDDLKENELLTIFQMFYHFNRRLPQTNGLLIVPYSEVPECTEKINLKLLYEMFKDAQSHGLVSIQFLCALGIFFGLNVSISKYALTNVYKKLLYETLNLKQFLT